MSSLGEYEIKEFSVVRRILSELYDETAHKSHMIGLIELNVTKARKLIENYEKKKNVKISFTGWLIRCIGQAVSENKKVHSYRWGRKKIITLEDVHVSIMIERTTADGKKVPITYVLKEVQNKSVLEITNEIRSVQERKIVEKNQFVSGTPKILIRLYPLTPKFIRRMFIRKLLRNTKFFIENAGTVSVTALGMFGKNLSGWAIPFSSNTLNIAIGGIKEKPILEKSKIINHEFLNISIQIDHKIVDGAPATRFVSRLAELVESGFELELLE
jgi:pyruvate/2-oxoglutarate dehydrogenase complex dihydrolipoamide acyltransferase (E2) component